MSTATFDVGSDGTVKARLVFASAEALAGMPLQDDDLQAFILHGVDVAADGSSCVPTFEGVSVTEVDGLVLSASYACPGSLQGLGEIAVTLYYLSDLAPGHREIARITAGSATSEAVLSGDRRAIALRLPEGARRAAREARKSTERKTAALVTVTAAFAALMAGLFAWRWRATRLGSKG